MEELKNSKILTKSEQLEFIEELFHEDSNFSKKKLETNKKKRKNYGFSV